MLMRTLLRQVPFFHAFEDEELDLLAGTEACFQRFAAGEFLIREGSTDTDLQVLIHGYATIFKGSIPEPPISLLGPGSVFGEMAFLTGNVRASNVQAREMCSVFRLNAPILASLPMAMQLKVKDQLIQVLIGHLQETTHSLLKQQEINRALVSAMECR